jgi:hexosaminidase
MISVFLLLSLAAQPDTGTISIIPRPVSLTVQEGAFVLTGTTTIHIHGYSNELADQLAGYLRPATGFPLPVTVEQAREDAIVLERDTSLARLGPEGYRLESKPGRVTIRAAGPAGIFYGIQTLRQLLPSAIFREAFTDRARWTIPAVIIEDYPRFTWRGAHLDVCRHFMPKEFVKKYIDLLALHKLNSFHWHLTDDQGWRIEIRKYPRLTEVGAWRDETLVGRYESDPAKRVFDDQRHGGFYTQDDMREIVAYARARFINVVPEIEMPGHAQAAIAAYPQLGNTGRNLSVLTIWGVSEDILNPEESTVRFMQDVLTEVLELFPSQFIHIGGDEAAKTQWRASARVQARMRELGLKNEEEMQSWFIHRMDEFLTARGRRLVGWDEILEGGLAPNATVMSWRGMAGGITAALSGHDVVMAPGSHTYFDHYQSQNRADEPLAIGGFTPIEKVYAFEPVPDTLPPEFRRHILGAQAQLWTEYITSPKQAEYMAYPRLTALAEVLWTPVERKDYRDFTTRLLGHLERLTVLDVNFRPLGP